MKKIYIKQALTCTKIEIKQVKAGCEMVSLLCVEAVSAS